MAALAEMIAEGTIGEVISDGNGPVGWSSAVVAGPERAGPDPAGAKGLLIEFGGLPGTGKSTLARWLAARLGAVLVRIDEIEGALRRHGLTADQTGIAAYGVAHDIAGSHLRRGLIVIADAVSPVEVARAGWRNLAQECSAGHLVIETQLANPDEHRRRVETRRAERSEEGAVQGGAVPVNDLPGWIYPNWEEVSRREYELRTDERLVVDTHQPIVVCRQDILDYLTGQTI